MFETDPYPGSPRILFIGHASSTHTSAWIDLLADSTMNVRLFGLESGGYPPESWHVRTYITTPYMPEGLNPNTRRWLHPTPEIAVREALRQQAEARIEAIRREQLHQELLKLKRNPFFWLRAFAGEYLCRARGEPLQRAKGRDSDLMRASSNTITSLPLGLDQGPRDTSADSSDSDWPHKLAVNPSFDMHEPAWGEIWHPPADSPEDWLEKIIAAWQPQIVHTLGIDPASFLFLKLYPRLGKKPKWVVQARGGPDLSLNRFLPGLDEKIRAILARCDRLIADNHENYAIAMEMGLDKEKCCPLGIVPGTGGISTAAFPRNGYSTPSRRERLIIWPKAYECPQSKALPVLEGIRKAWPYIKPCKIYMTAVIQEEIHMWFNALPEQIRLNCFLLERIPREALLELLTRARVLLAPSLSDGIPNTLYEAMAAGAFPIVSPLNTISSVVSNERNVLFARNLYPDEIADALKRSMSDDALVDSAAIENAGLVKQLADREAIRPRVVSFYKDLAAS